MRDAEIRFVSVNWVNFLVRVETNAHFAGSERSPRKDAVCYYVIAFSNSTTTAYLR